MKNLTKIMLAALMLLTVVSMSFAMGGGETKKKADLVYANWEEGIAYTHLAKVVLQDMMGYDVTITPSDVAPAYASVAAGDQDAFMETWLPTLHKDYIEKYGEELTDLGHVYEGTQSGLAVPTYMVEDGVETISDLAKPEVIEKLGGSITGIDAGAGVMKTTEDEAMPAYGLKEAGLELMASSGPAMMAALKDAYQNEEYIVVTGWKPHSMFGYFDMQFLKQDKKEIWGEGNIHITGRKNIKEDKPELAQFLSNMRLTTAEVGSLMVAIRESSSDEETAARDWLKENKDVVMDWIPE